MPKFAFILKRNSFVFFLALLCFSCQKKTVYSNYRSLDNARWAFKDPITFGCAIPDTNYTYNGYLHFSIYTDYPFRNVWFRYQLGKNQKEQKKQIMLASKQGKWLGKGGGRTRRYRIPLFQNRKIQTNDSFNMEVTQYMRVDTLKGINTIGFELCKGNEVF